MSSSHFESLMSKRKIRHLERRRKIREQKAKYSILSSWAGNLFCLELMNSYQTLGAFFSYDFSIKKYQVSFFCLAGILERDYGDSYAQILDIAWKRGCKYEVRGVLCEYAKRWGS
jgi:hypothetical protein